MAKATKTAKKSVKKKVGTPSPTKKKTSTGNRPKKASTGSAAKKTSTGTSGVPRKKVTKVAQPRVVSRRATNTIPVKPALKKKRTVSSTSETVRAVKEKLATLSSAERVYYDKISALMRDDRLASNLRNHEIGRLLMDCEKKNPKSNSAEIIREAVGLDKATARVYRLVAQRCPSEKEFKEICEYKNKETGWTVPWNTVYSILQRAPSHKKRMEYVHSVVDEQMSRETFDRRFPLGENEHGQPVSVRTITYKSTVKKLITTLDREMDVLSLIMSKKVYEAMGGDAESMRGDTEAAIDKLRQASNLIPEVIDSLEGWLENPELAEANARAATAKEEEYSEA